jgi:hypothetical protein
MKTQGNSTCPWLCCIRFDFDVGQESNTAQKKGAGRWGYQCPSGCQCKNTIIHTTIKQKTNQINNQFVRHTNNNNLVQVVFVCDQ